MSKELSPQALALCKTFDLNADPNDPWADVYSSGRYKIITRQGIDKIEAKAGVITESLECLFIDPYEVVFKGVFSGNGNRVVTTASASVDRVQPVYISRKGLHPGLKEKIKSLLPTIGEDSSKAILDVLTKDVFIEEETGNVATGTDKQGNPIYATICLKKGNVQQSPAYLPEMAEKRCKSRGILKLVGFYELGFYSQDEAEDFDKVIREARSGGGSTKKPTTAKVEA
jgi:hypothetical protein